MSMKNNLRLYYLEQYKSDELSEWINEDVTFKDLLLCLNNNECVYELIGVYDSIVRERLFSGLSKEIGCSYNDVYTNWLDIPKRPQVRTKDVDKMLDIFDSFIKTNEI